MPDVTITVSDALVARLNVLLAEYNLRNLANLTLRQWMQLHFRELAIGRELAASAVQIQEQAQADVAAAIQAEKERLLGLV